MKDQVKIFRPKKIEVDIFGSKHELHRLTRGDVIDLAVIFSEARQDLTGLTVENLKKIILSTGEILGALMEISFPSFEEWSALSIADEITLFEMCWSENDIPGIIANFTRLGETIAAAINAGQ